MATGPWPLGRTWRSGVVSSFDEERGLGTVRDDDGTVYEFHCTTVADGSRTIEVGRSVLFMVGPGRRGRLEARDLAGR